MAPSLSLDVQHVWRLASVIVLLWLAWFFGRTLARHKTPLIEQIARRGEPELKPMLVTYTRRLTWLWCAYFLAGALLSAILISSAFPVGPLVGLGSVLLFVGEHAVRPRIFPGEVFPGLAQQVRDTWAVWH
ncbi:MAG TPA: hypothetical protein VL593_06325 [Ramlibacter sp.]|jgi:uncharacterized membrane protein|nr:hypothetical protein [Ramlibacter sp.]